jgi:hypothetical protein
MVLTGEDIAAVKTYGAIIIVTNCEKEAAKDKSLPTGSYIITCEHNGQQWYDIVMGSRFSIFDAYYDRFGGVIKKMEWTSGNISPRMWGYKSKEEKKSKGR